MSGPADFSVRDEGSIVVLTPNTTNGKLWASENVCAPEWAHFGAGIVIEHRYADDILAGIAEDGLVAVSV